MSAEFEKFVEDHRCYNFKVTKVKNRKDPEYQNSRDIKLREAFMGRVTLHHAVDHEYGAGFCILVNEGFTMRTSLVREVVRKGPSRWLCKTLNSVYRVEVVR